MPKPARKKSPNRPSARRLEDGVKPSLQYSILCDQVQQLADGSAVIVRPFDTINRVGAQIVPASFVILNGWTSGLGVWNEHITISDPADRVILEEQEQSFWLQSPWHRHNVQRNITIALADAGTYKITVFLANQAILTYRFRFIVHTVPPAAN